MSRSAATDLIALLMLGGAGAIIAWPKIRVLVAGGGVIPGVSVTGSGQVATPADTGVKLPTSGPLGIRNNNPGNLRPSLIPFDGTIGTNRGYAVFKSPVYGVRALMKLLRNYKALYGLNTIAKIGARYAPSGENNTGAWVSNVALISGIGQNMALDLNNKQTMFNLVRGIIGAENGKSYANAFDNVLEQAWGLL